MTNPVAPKTDTPATQIPEDLKTQCPICKGEGKVQRRGFASAGDMDANSEPRMITQSCYQCHSKGWLWALSDDEMAERIANLESTLAAERASRLQADTERYDKGWNDAIKAAAERADYYDLNIFDYAGEAVSALSKPSVSPEQAEETK